MVGGEFGEKNHRGGDDSVGFLGHGDAFSVDESVAVDDFDSGFVGLDIHQNPLHLNLIFLIRLEQILPKIRLLKLLFRLLIIPKQLFFGPNSRFFNTIP